MIGEFFMFDNFKNSKNKFAQPPGTVYYTGVGSLPTTIKKILYKKDQIVINEKVEDANEYVEWIQVNGLQDSDTILKELEKLNVDSMITEDIFNLNQRAKIEEIDNGLFAIIFTSDISKPDFAREYFSVLMVGKTVITFIDADSTTLVPIEKRIIENKGKIRSMDAAYLFYSIIDTLVDVDIIFEHDITKLMIENEDLIMEDKLDSLDKLHVIRREILFMRSSISSLMDSVIELKIKTNNADSIKSIRKYYLDLLDHLFRLNQRLNVHWEEIKSLYDVYMNNLSDRTNSIMKTLTIFSAIFIPLSFLAGVFGMNFDSMTIFRSQYGVFIFIAACLAIVLFMIVFFKRRKWF